jgi:hypothetical protein
MAAFRWSLGVFALLGLCCLVAGCNPGVGTAGDPVTAVLMQGGQPIMGEGSEDEDEDQDEDENDDFGWEVKLFLLDESGGFADAMECSGDLDAGSEITIFGPSMQDLPKGRYRVAVHNWGPGDNPQRDEEGDIIPVDLLEEEFSKENSTMEVDVKPGSKITINLDDGTVQ